MTYPEIQLNTPIIIQSEITGSNITVIKIEERPSLKLVTAEILIGNASRIINVWSGTDYDQIGQWTDSDMELRIKQILEQQ